MKEKDLMDEILEEASTLKKTGKKGELQANIMVHKAMLDINEELLRRLEEKEFN